MSLNRTVLMGRLTADPILRYTATNLPVTSFALAVEKDTKDKETGKRGADFFEIVCWRSTAEFVGKHFTKGMQIVVSGSLQTRIWKDKDGNNRKTVEIVADVVYFADGKRDREPTADINTLAGRMPETDETDAFLELADDSELPFG